MSRPPITMSAGTDTFLAASSPFEYALHAARSVCNTPFFMRRMSERLFPGSHMPGTAWLLPNCEAGANDQSMIMRRALSSSSLAASSSASPTAIGTAVPMSASLRTRSGLRADSSSAVSEPML